MDSLLVKIFATALTLSQVTTAPDSVKTQFDRVQDQTEVVHLLQAGCAHMRKVFDIEDLNVDDLIATAMDDPQAFTGGVAAFRGINFSDLFTSYRQFCKNEAVPQSPVDIGEVIDFYNQAVANLPDYTRLKGLKLRGETVVLDGKGQPFTEIFDHDQRRVWVPLADIPKPVQKAFIAAEDKRFYEHKGIDERGLIRAFIGNLAQSGRPQGGSTITQQVVKNLLVGEDLTYERKMREMIVASRIEHALSKDEILELYLNSTYLGRGSWGVEMAARSYFGKSVGALNVGEGALLAGLTKGPNYFNPDRHPDRAQERRAYVLGRMQEDGVISADEMKRLNAITPKLVAYDRPRRDIGYHFVDQLAREAKSVAGVDALTADSYTVRSTLNPQLQRATEAALQEGLARFEMQEGRVQFQMPEANLADAVHRIDGARKEPAAKPPWQEALQNARLPLYDVHWPGAVVIEKSSTRGGGESIKVGLADGRVLPLTVRASIQRGLKLYDVVLIHIAEAKGKTARAELRVRPTVQGAAVVLENKTGRILAMSGGFSYPLSQLNRTTQSQRQPGSAFKPFTYLAALQKGLQPNTLVRDEPITLPPIGGSGILAREGDSWSPKNYAGGGGGIVTMRRALEGSKNLATVNLLDGGIDSTPSASLDRICALALEAHVYKDCVPYYPFVLGAQPVRPIDLAAFYAAIANEGLRPTPYAIEEIDHNGSAIYRHPDGTSSQIGSADRASFYQLKTMIQGVLAHGTAHAIASLAPYVAGKTGTTDSENDAWFVGFTNDVTVAVWVGYDNADGKRRTLGGGQTGASVAIPIFEPIIQASWTYYAPRTPLAPPSAEAKRDLVAVRGDEGANGRGLVEYLRRDANGQARDARYDLVSPGEVETADYGYPDPGYGETQYDSWGRPLPNQPQRPQPWGDERQWGPRPQPFGGLFGWQQQAPPPPQPRYVDPRRQPRQYNNGQYNNGQYNSGQYYNGGSIFDRN